MKLIKQLFDICFDYTMSSTVPIERIKIQWACNNHEIAYNMVRVCLFFNLTANIYDFIYTVIQEDMPFPFMAFFLDSQMPSFGTEMKEYCVDYFDATLFSNTISVVRELPYKEQKEFFRHLLTKFPYQLYVSHISVNTNEAIMLLQSFANLNYTYEVSYLFAKYSAILNFNSLSAMKIATKYYRTAIEIKPLSAQAWSGWSFTNFRIFIMLKESDQLNNSNVGSLNEYYNKNENSNKADLSENEELKDIVEVLESDKARKISEEVLANVEYKDLYKPLSEANHQYEKNVMEFRQKISQFYPQSNDPNYYGANAIQGLLHAINLTTENSLEYLCQLCFILFTMTNSKLITDDTIESIINIPTAKLFLVAPQITSHMHHKDPRIKAIVYNLLNNIGSEYFQEIFFALNLYSLDGSQIAQEILYFLKNNNSQTLYEEVEMFADGMIRSACTWLEEWKKSLEIIILDPELIDSILPPLFEKLYHPKCELDSFFIRIYGKIIIDQIKELYEKHSQSSISQMMIKIKQIHASIKDIVGKLSVLVLHKVSENLASKRHFEMKVPGSHNETIDYIEPVMDVLGTQQHPRCVTIVSNHGERIKFLLKGSEDLRIDERFMQFFSLVNIIIKHSRSLEGLIVAHYPVIPLAINSGLIKFYTISVTFHQMILEARKIYNIPYSIESIIEDDYCGNLSLKLNSLQKFELFNLVADKCKAYELADITSRYSPSSVAHLAKRAMFTRTTAIMSIIGYIIGLGDRHPSNIMIQKSSGSIIHIDFGDAFESTILRSSFPEKVPFRMTRMFMNAIEGNVTDGLFEKTCIELMKLLRKKRSTLSSQLTIFLQEPLEFSREETDEKRKYIIDRINLKLNGKEFGDGKSESTVEDQVRILINEAINPQNYCQHYPGWCPYW
ncbi:hypothetical protein TRFO_12607 [Tritrichomonas foetus]|uniref:non-specific serine/threonine protein kinase n=1 Tax=Tritrichomonas foetus TaxID=1144522 RepID=A0A1J4L2E3_9EUKA|nr:hypothetical protein TRFO_12607 [Tritrichomonas foetus]|eukprot:OHT17256.1 hypothetical protein TRFO_12607 [Tritrichomonas foetus]